MHTINRNARGGSIALVLLAAALLRIVWMLLVPIEPVSDSYLYDVFARNIATGKGYTFFDGGFTVYWPVGASAIYALVYKVLGFSYWSIGLFQLLLGVAIVWLTYQIALYFFNKAVAILAAWVMALWPIFIQYTTIMASELIFIFLILLAIYFWTRETINFPLRTLLWTLAICLGAFVRPTAFPLFVIFLMADFLRNRQAKQLLVSSLVMLMTAACLFTPWALRNHQHFGHYVLVSANSGVNLWMGNNPQSNGGYMHLPEKGFKNEVERDRYFKQQAVEFIRENPLQYIELAAKRFFITYRAETIGVLWNGAIVQRHVAVVMPLKLISSLYWWILFSLGLIGVYAFVRNTPANLFHVLVMVAGLFFVIPILTVGQDRYHMALNPFLAIFAAVWVKEVLGSKFGGR